MTWQTHHDGVVAYRHTTRQQRQQEQQQQQHKAAVLAAANTRSSTISSPFHAHHTGVASRRATVSLMSIRSLS